MTKAKSDIVTRLRKFEAIRKRSRKKAIKDDRGFPTSQMTRDVRMSRDAADEITRLRALLKEAEGVLDWYSEKATSLSRNDWKELPQMAEAIFVELQLDGGKRARSFLTRIRNGEV